MSEERRSYPIVIIALLVMAVILGAFLNSIGFFKTAAHTQVTVYNPCRVCGQELYHEELDFFITTYVGDIPVLTPIYKTVLHVCHGR